MSSWSADFSYQGPEPPPEQTISNIFTYAGYDTFQHQSGTTYTFDAPPPQDTIYNNLINAISENGMYDDDQGMVNGVTLTAASS